jgi:NAD(P)-dependent dehydrogenase (short-subunit alcohol dehydrogenase family)
MSSGRLYGKRAIVTGATAGIGDAIARRFAAEGARLVLVARRSRPGEALAAELADAGALFVEGDIGRPETGTRAVETSIAAFGGLDILVNNAGMDFYGDFLDAGREQMRDVFEVNVFGQVSITQAAVGRMKSDGGGSIVNIASRTAVVGVPTMSVYGASKGALLSMTRALAVELAPSRIRVNAVLPGLTDTPLVRSWLSSASDGEAVKAAAMAKIPLGRFAAADDVASAVLFLASDEAAYITGAGIPVDGGYTAA